MSGLHFTTITNPAPHPLLCTTGTHLITYVVFSEKEFAVITQTLSSSINFIYPILLESFSNLFLLFNFEKSSITSEGELPAS